MGNISVLEQQAREIIQPQVDRFFERFDPPRGRLIFALDATASRQPSWDTAAKLQAEMFTAAGGLDMQLVYYRGLNELVASRWLADAKSLTAVMAQVVCHAGTTQIERVLRHARAEHQRQPINALVLISDACEETPALLYDAAAGLGGVPAFVFQEGGDRSVEDTYRQIASITNGAYARFDASAAARLGDLLKAVAVFAGGGLKALAAQKTDAATLLLEQLKSERRS
jgi:hypothetical protein